MEPINNRIRELREARGWSQQALAERVFPPTTKTQISKLENGQRDLSDDWKRRLAAALDVAPLDLVPGLGMATTEQEQSILNMYRMLSDDDRSKFENLVKIFIKIENSDE